MANASFEELVQSWRSTHGRYSTCEVHHSSVHTPSAAATPDREANQTLIEAIAKAHRWQEQLESGEYPSIEDLANAVSVDRTYVGRMLRLTSLAPDIIEVILRGDEPDGISLTKLRRNLPVRWEEQREVWK